MNHAGHDIALLYDFLQVRGGAEGVTLALQEHLPGAHIVTASRTPGLFDDIGPERATVLDSRPTATSLPLRSMRTWRTFSRLRRGQLAPAALFSGHFAPLAVEACPPGQRVFYAHAAPLPFSRDDESVTLAAQSPLIRGFARPALKLLQRATAKALAAMDRRFANSKFVAGRLERAFGVSAEVLYPPCDTAPFRWTGQGGYYLTMGRHVPQKRIDLVVRAFLELHDRQLVVASSGSETEALKRIAGGAPNIRFVDTPTREDLAALTGRAIATLHVGENEAFGMTLVESLAAGKPVITAASGGCAEIVDDGRTGILLEADPTPGAIAGAVSDLTAEAAHAMRSSAEAAAVPFGPERFYAAVASALGR